jgi:hypothetical protein
MIMMVEIRMPQADDTLFIRIKSDDQLKEKLFPWKIIL